MDLSSQTTPSLADKDLILLYGKGGTDGYATELSKIGKADGSTPFISVSSAAGEIGSTGTSLNSTGFGLYLEDDEYSAFTNTKSRGIGGISSTFNSGRLKNHESYVGFLDTNNAVSTNPIENGEIILGKSTSNTTSSSSFEDCAAIYINEKNIEGASLVNTTSSVIYSSGQQSGTLTPLTSGQLPAIITIEDPTDNTKWVQYRCTAVTEPAEVAATFETTSMASTSGTTPGTVNFDGVSSTITSSTSAAAIAAIIAGKTYPNYTAAVTNTDRVTFTQRVAGIGGNITLVASDRSYLTAALSTHTIGKQGGGSPGDFEGGTGGMQIFTVKYIGGATGSVVDTFSDNTRVIFTSERVANNLASGPVSYKGTLGTTATNGKLYSSVGSAKVYCGEGNSTTQSENDFYIDDVGIWKVSQPSITVERDITSEGAQTHNSGAVIYLLSDDSPTIGGADLQYVDDTDDSLATAPIYDNVDKDQLWRNALLQINNEKILFGESDPDGANWNNAFGWARSLEGTNFAVHSAQNITVIPRHYFFHSFTGNTVTNTGFDPTHSLYKPVVSAYLDSDGKINASAYIQNTSYQNPLMLKSKVSIPIDGQTPTHVAITFDSQVPSQNFKLYLNGKLEDATGYRATTGTNDNLQNDADGKGGEPLLSMGTVCIGGMPRQGTTTATSYGTNGFDGAIEEVCLWDRIVDFVVPTTGKLKFTRPFIEIESGQNKSMSNTFYSRLYIKDYHNIRGKSEKEVTASPLVGIRKSAFAINTL